jgi:integrase
VVSLANRDSRHHRRRLAERDGFSIPAPGLIYISRKFTNSRISEFQNFDMPRIRKTTLKRKNKAGRVEWFARIRWTDANGKEHTREKAATSKTHAKALADQLAGKFAEGGAEAVDAEKMTLSELIAQFKKSEVIEAVFSGERKIAGYKHPEKVETKLNTLGKFLGGHRIQELDYYAIRDFKLALLATPTVRKKPRSISDVNHHLRILRHVLNFACLKRWLLRNPFRDGEPLISEADEIPRDRAERAGEQDRLLAVCVGERAHLRPIIICAIDTALRYGEIMRITRADVNFYTKLITARAKTTKTNTPRFVPISTRLESELRVLCAAAPDNHTPIFGTQNSIRRAWQTACRLAGIHGLQFRDLRHWATTAFAEAIAEAGLAQEHGMKITGHTQERTYRRYIRTTQRAVQQVGAALESHRKAKSGD